MGTALKATTAWNKKFWPTGGEERAFLLVELTGEAKGTLNNRAPINLSLVLDRSGSMEGAPLEYSKKACQFAANQLDSHDQLSIVVFDDQVQTIFAHQNAMQKTIMKQKIEAIQSGGSTNLSGGLLQGIQHVKHSLEQGSVNRVILLSDGHANEGITDRSKLLAIAKEFRGMGIGTSTMGVGDGFDEELMAGLADHGGGNFYFIAKPEDIPAIFSEELQGLLSVTAQNVELTINHAEGVTIKQVYGYKSEQVEGGLKLSLGDVFEGETKSILVELSFNPHAVGTHHIFDMQWNYADVTEGVKLCSLKHSAEANFTNDLELLGQTADPHVEKEIKITETAIAIETAIAAFDCGDEERGIRLLQQQADTMLCAAIQSEDAELREEAQLLYNQLEGFSYSNYTRKTLHEKKIRQMKRKK
ncbi:vWA domain-containing protein [Candidatus Pristimantibacillus sp. PTI5]|uniref:vWA domain-containing protein n=1 Tax=Candidatus Pristimantibacillus sp. PTI5 TaxID=3400422 RepID=UPI003B02628E